MSAEKPPKKIDTNITLAIIGLISAAIVAAISNADKLAAAFQHPEPAPIVTMTAELPPTLVVLTSTIPPTVMPTDTVPSGKPTSTMAPATDTPTPAPTPVPLGQDWPQDCISTLWLPEPPDGQPQPIKGDNGCWLQPVYSFETNNGLEFQDNGKYNASSAYGLFAPLPGTKGTVTIKVGLQELTRADLIVGVYTQPSLESDGYLIAIPAGNVKKAKILKKISYRNYNTDVPTAPVDQLDGYTIEFSYTAGSVYASVPGVIKFPTNTLQSQTGQKYIFIGYRTVGPAYVADGTFLSLKLSQ